MVKKKAKGKKKRLDKRSQASRPQGKKAQSQVLFKPRRVASAQQLLTIHNQSLKNSQRDQAEAARIQTAEREQLKSEKLQLERAVLEAKFQQLNQYQIAP
mgnify:CR=1 FL=1